MATFNSVQYTNATNVPVDLAPPIDMGGRKRIAYAKYSTLAGIAAGDILNLFKLPKNARVTSMEMVVPASFVTSSAKIGITGDDDRYGSAVDLSSAGRHQFLLAVADIDYKTVTEGVIVLATFVTGDPAASKDICVICEYVVD